MKRAGCEPCGSSSALLQCFGVLRRQDGVVEVIYPALQAVAGGWGKRRTAREIGELFAHTTVRGWCHRHQERAAWSEVRDRRCCRRCPVVECCFRCAVVLLM